MRVGLVGLGKMGMSHMAMLNAHPEAELVAICDPTPFVPDILGKYTGAAVYADYDDLLRREKLDAVLIATPTKLHAPMVRAALARDLHVFCEKPFCLDPIEGQELADMAQARGLVNQVGYHYRFVGAFREAKRLVAAGVLGRIHHVRAEAYGPVVLRPKGSTWRAAKETGGGCLYDYACHAIDLVGYLFEAPTEVGGSVLNRVFSRQVEDEVYSTLYFPGGATGQLAANWSDESHRKMSARLTLWGENGRMNIDRQELQVFIRDASELSEKLDEGWNVRYTTDMTNEVWYYLRGEEYSEQIDHFIKSIKIGDRNNISSFASAVATDRVAQMISKDAGAGRLSPARGQSEIGAVPSKPKGFFKGLRTALR